jgi:phospholipase/lecithinase/hemolysin
LPAWSGDLVTSGHDVRAGCPGFVFFDGVHPTTAAHFLISELFEQAILVPSSLALLLAGAGGLLVAAGYRRRPRHPSSTASSSPGGRGRSSARVTA